jgi:hypothetical protein
MSQFLWVPGGETHSFCDTVRTRVAEHASPPVSNSHLLRHPTVSETLLDLEKTVDIENGPPAG